MPESGKSRPTLRTIAELSGLAVPTVSRALNDAPDIGTATKEKVRAIAAQIGYIPNRAGLRLRTGKTNVISIVLCSDHEVTDHTGQLVSSIAHALRDTRYHLIVTPYFPDEDPMQPVRYILETGSADALILNRIEVDDPRVAHLLERKFPFATYGRSKWRDLHPYFDFDNTSFGHLAAETLIGSGRKNIAMLTPPLNQNYAQDMLKGAREVISRSDATFEVVPGITSDVTGEDIKQGIAAFLQNRADIDGIIAPSSTSAIFASVGAERAGRVIGKDLDVFAKEAVPFLKHFREAIKVVKEDVQNAGAFLATAAIQAIESPDKKPRQSLISARLT
ncbi:LacI family transcriptional regulator [Ruegeria sp. 2205SS24-7]|uniref:LacI family transcriptional regulator n=1 Tax=Ruegeria discodermiae TaxID=3064389 RepID=UPI0027419523|nr:LacI family transcriptional regulator [Ruegeria sp. 2205SS24-7]MDP5217335.1 LacI family transcriptional regulator [Ruegeria sp. 2205SS24-7]